MFVQLAEPAKVQDQENAWGMISSYGTVAPIASTKYDDTLLNVPPIVTEATRSAVTVTFVVAVKSTSLLFPEAARTTLTVSGAVAAYDATSVVVRL